MSQKNVKLSRREAQGRVLPDKDRDDLLVGEFHSGPLPSPADLREYDKINPEFSKSIVNNFNKQVSHRTFMEKWLMISFSYLAPTFSLIIILFAFYLGYRLLLADKDLAGWVSMFVPLGIVAAIFYTQRRNERSSEK